MALGSKKASDTLKSRLILCWWWLSDGNFWASLPPPLSLAAAKPITVC